MIPNSFLILAGGESSEKEISLQTGKSVYNAMQTLGWRSKLKIIHTFDEILHLNLLENPYVFLAFHGGFGENGCVQSFLSAQKKIYNGANHISSGIGINKLLTKLIASSLNIPCPKYILWNPEFEKKYSYDFVKQRLGSPFIIKPVSQGCSKGLSFVKNESQYIQALQKANAFENQILMEEFIEGREFTVGILAGDMLPIIEVSHSHILFDYEAKFSSESTSYKEFFVPNSVKKHISQLSFELFKVLNIHDYGRLDFILDTQNTPHLLEINTLPGLTEKSVYPQACALKKLSYKDMIKKIIMSATMK
ncbi:MULTISPECIES: D-alanine--D-alanine ligase family protein [Bacillus cereus group]|uniref:D-alanine--D-alanine ligase family protein n=1 Tax=Bacillus cereus group TaxID=86661 RepID=UPI001C026552|nr:MULTISPECIES: D-alanine--D-alanine ligase [Bacillus cereus group]